MTTFGKRLAVLRNKKGLSQAEFARVLGMGQSTIAMYETDKRLPDAATIKKLADYFNVTVDYLLGWTDSIEIDIIDLLEARNNALIAGEKSLTTDQRLALLNLIGDKHNQLELHPQVEQFAQRLDDLFKENPAITDQAMETIIQDLAEYVEFKVTQYSKSE